MPEFTQTMQDEHEIRALLERYTTAVNLRDWPAYQACWTADAVWELLEPLNGRHVGLPAIMAEVTKTVETLEVFVQMTHSIVVRDLTATTAKAVVTLNEIGRPKPGSDFPFPSMFILAMYFDDLVKQDGQWKFKQRTYKVAYWDATRLPGDAHQLAWVNTVPYHA